MHRIADRIAAAVAVFAVAAGVTPLAAQHYKGKQITVVVASGAGGTMDTNGRQISQYLGRHLPGSPTVVVQNMPGGSGLHATNYVYELAKPDGLTLYYGVWFPTAQILKLAELKAQYDKMGIVGAGSDTRSVVMRRDLAQRIEKPADIMSNKGFIVGGTSLNGQQDLLNRMSLDLLGATYKMVSGYGSGAESFLALARNEIDVLNNSYATVVRRSGPDIKAGKLMPMYYFCTVGANGEVKRADFIKDTPCYYDLYREIYGKMPSGDLFEAFNFYTSAVSHLTYILAAPPGTPPELLTQLREAYTKAVVEPDFVNYYVKTTGFGPELASLDDALAIMSSMGSVKPAVTAMLKKYYDTGR